MLTEINTRLVKVLATRHPEFRDVDRHPGRMTVDDIKRVAAFSPALRIGPFGKISTQKLANGELELSVPFAAAVITNEVGLLESQDMAIKLAAAVSRTLPGFAPGMANEDDNWPAMPGVGLCQDVAIDIAAGTELEDDGIALWAVLFKVCVTIGEDLAFAEATAAVDLEFSGRIDPTEVDV